ncbi:MAG: sporulation protein YqfD [Clostridia bacterium]
MSTSIKHKTTEKKPSKKQTQEAEKNKNKAEKPQNIDIKQQKKAKKTQNNEIKKKKKAQKNEIKKQKQEVEKNKKIENKLSKKKKKAEKIAREKEILIEEAERYARHKTPLKKLADRFGKVQFEVVGVNFARLISSLSRNFKIEKAVTNGNVLTFFVGAKHSDKIIAYLDSLCYNYRIIYRVGASRAMILLFDRLGIVVGIVATVAIMILYPHFVTEVDIDGELTAEARNILQTNGVYQGNFVWDFDGAEISKQLQSQDGIAFASVEKRGSHVYVKITAEQGKHDFVDISGGRVVAKTRAVVSRVLVHGGTAEVKYGDVVNAGDTLIGDYVLVGETKVKTVAVGEVYGRVYCKMSRYFADKEIVNVVGRTAEFCRIAMFGKTPKTPKAPFGAYSLEISKKESDFLLPYTVYTYRFFEIETVEVANTKTKDEMSKEVFSALLNTLSPEAKFVDSFSKVSRVEGGYMVDTTIECEQRIDKIEK